MTVTFDFDGTLQRPIVQDYATELISKGVNVHILTSRYDELHKHLYLINPTNSDLFEVARKLKIPFQHIHFTNMQDKATYLYDTNVIWHLDDDQNELYSIQQMKCKTVGIKFVGGWKSKCNRLINAE